MARASLAFFYKTKLWLDFRAAYIEARLLKDGDYICDHCGKPIDKSGDIHLHHIEEITEENVYDALITLNPKNIAMVHSGCHNIIEDRFAYQKKVYLIYGPPLSGKTTYALERMKRGDIIVDIDLIYQSITGCNLYDKPNSLKMNIFRIQDVMIDNIKTRYGGWRNAYIVGGYPDRYKREMIANTTGAEIIFMDVDKEECLRRLKSSSRNGNEKEWEKYINKWFERAT